MVLAQDSQGAPTRFFTLNRDPLSALPDEGGLRMAGGVGASWMNIAIVKGGYHAVNYQYDVIGFNLFGRSPVADGGSMGNCGWGILMETLYPQMCDTERQPLPTTPSSRAETDFDIRFKDCLARLQLPDRFMEFEAFRSSEKWRSIVCQRGRHFFPEDLSRIGASTGWRNVLDGPADSYARTSPHLFEDYPYYVFYTIWDIGPSEDVVPS